MTRSRRDLKPEIALIGAHGSPIRGKLRLDLEPAGRQEDHMSS